METFKLLIDTDIGADVDDSLAIYSAISYGINIVGITTVFKNTQERARLAKKLVSLCRLNIPVYAGEGDVLCKQMIKTDPTMFYSEDLSEEIYTPNSSIEKLSGVDFIVESAKKYGKDLIILGIGPLTNLAQAYKKDPEAMRKVGKIVIMGGAYFSARPEWNIFCDPEAAEVVFKSELNLYCVGSDITVKTKLPFVYQEEILSHAKENSALGFVCNHAFSWIEKRKFGITLHDPLALYAIIKPEFLHFKKQRIGVETEGKHTRGMTFNYSLTNLYPFNKGIEVYVADYTDEEAVMSEFMTVVIRGNRR